MTNRVDTKRKDINTRIARGEPITVCGLVLYPIKMTDYEEYLHCKDALALRQSTFPVKYLKKDFLSAVFSMEIDLIQSEKGSSGIVFRIINLLFLALRIDENRKEIMDKCLRFDPKTKELKFIEVPSDGEIVSLSPVDFSTRIRPILAAQNGIELPKEMQNLDLVESNEWLKSQKKGDVKLNVNISDSIASVALQSGIRAKEILDWTVLEYEQRRRAIEREKKYMLYQSAELSGMVTFKKGNPAPSWEFDVLDDSLGTVSLSELGNRVRGLKEK